MNAFDNREFEAYKVEAKERWGNTEAYAEYAERSKNSSHETNQALVAGMDAVLGEFAHCMNSGAAPDSASAQALVKQLQEYISEHFYTCTHQILAGLGQMYMADERFQNNIDKHAAGTAGFISKAIEHYCAETE